MSTANNYQQARNAFRRDLGNYTTYDSLPNRPGNPYSGSPFSAFERGDTAYVIGQGRVWLADVGTPGGGDAVWIYETRVPFVRANGATVQGVSVDGSVPVLFTIGSLTSTALYAAQDFTGNNPLSEFTWNGTAPADIEVSAEIEISAGVLAVTPTVGIQVLRNLVPEVTGLVIPIEPLRRRTLPIRTILGNVLVGDALSIGVFTLGMDPADGYDITNKSVCMNVLGAPIG